MAASKMGRPVKKVADKMVAVSITVTPRHHEWLEKWASKHSRKANVPASASAVVRASIRHAEACLKSGTLTEDEFERMME